MIPSVSGIYTSPAMRCIETALWVAKRYDRDEVESIDSLAKDSTVENFMEFVRELDHDAVLVGHEPLLSAVIRNLLGAPETTPLELKKGGAAAFRTDGSGAFRLEWLATPRILRRLGRR